MGSELESTDFNGDGRADLLIGAVNFDPYGAAGVSGMGAVYLYMGQAGLSGLVDLSGAFQAFHGPEYQDASMGYRRTIMPAGDVDFDNRQDFLISAPGAGSQMGAGEHIGAIFLVRGADFVGVTQTPTN